MFLARLIFGISPENNRYYGGLTGNLLPGKNQFNFG